jgi:hypothetical protein
LQREVREEHTMPRSQAQASPIGKSVLIRQLELRVENVINELAMMPFAGEKTEELRADLELLKAELETFRIGPLIN